MRWNPLRQTRCLRARTSRAAQVGPQPRGIEPLEPRLLFAAGDLDPNFGAGGKVRHDFHPTTEDAWDVVTLSGGGLVAAGEVDGRFWVAKYTASGALDTTFGGGTGYAIAPLETFGGAAAVAVQADGSVLLSGSDNHGPAFADGSNFVVMRYTPAGVLDTTWGTGGVVSRSYTGGLHSSAQKILVQPDGKVLIAGSDSHEAFVAARLNANGAYDPTFGTGGIARITSAEFPGGAATAMLLRPDGKILLAGRVGGHSVGLVRLTTGGALDPTFDGDGQAVGIATSAFYFPRGMAIAPDGNIVVGGYIDGPSQNAGPNGDPFLERFGPNGAHAGLIPIDPEVEDFPFFAHDLHMLEDGTMLLPGSLGPMTILAFKPDGMLDPTFGEGGKVTAEFSAQFGAGARAIDVDQAGRIVAVGAMVTGNGTSPTWIPPYDIVLARFLGRPVPPPAQPVTLRSPADAYVRDGASAATNFGTGPELLVKRSGTVGNSREAYLRFDLSAVPTVASATLRLFGKLSNTVNPSVVTTVYSAADTTWGESAITWNNKPAAGTTSRGTITVGGTTARWYELDLTSFLKAEKAAGRNLVTLVLKNGAISDAQTTFNSDEAASERPELVVTPEGPPPQGLVVSASNLSVPEGGSAAFTVRLAARPAADVTVAVAKGATGDADLNAATTSLVFTPADWQTPQAVTVAAAEDADASNGSATFTIGSTGLPDKTVTAAEADNDVPPPPPPPTGPVTLRAGADAYVRDGTSAGLNFGTSTQLQARKGATVNNNRDTYLRFDLSSVPLADIGTARLRLNGRLDSTAAASAGFTVYSATSTTWSETGLTWNNKPASGTTSRGSATVTGTTAKWYEVNLATFLRAEKAAGRNVVTLVIKATAASAATILFNSDEATGSRPELVIAPPPQGIVTSASTLNVNEGGSASFTVKLAARPTANVFVNLARSSSGDLSLAAGTPALTFTPDNWNVAQTVVIAAAEDPDTANGTAAFTLSAPNLPSKTVTATEVDNDIVRLRAAADAYVRDGTSAGLNFGTSTQLQARRGATAGNHREAYLRFNLTSMTVATAKLRLNAKLDGTAAASAGFTVYSSTNTTWSETGLTWNNRPAAGATALRSATVSGTTSKWYELDLTDFLKAERAAGRTAVTLVIRASAASAATVLFNSDEAAGSRPELVVTSL
jgi:uncharacterized delta-60 repeat protein